MQLNEAHSLWILNKNEDTYNQLGTTLLAYVNKEIRRQWRSRGNKTEQEDLQGEALIRVFQNIDKFNNRSSFATWVSKIIFNEGERMLGKLAASKTQAFVGDESYDLGPSLQDKLTLRQLVSILDKEDQRMVQLKIEGFDDQEIAEAFAIPIGTMKSRWNAIQNRLRTHSGGKFPLGV